METHRDVQCLAERELAVAVAVARGHSVDEIGAWFAENRDQVEHHLRRACHKLGLRTVAEMQPLLARHAC